MSILSPYYGTEVTAGTNVEVTVKARDRSGVVRVRLEYSGAVSGAAEGVVDPSELAVTVIFPLPVPADAADLSRITLTAYAGDAAGNLGHSKSWKLIVRSSDPSGTPTKPKDTPRRRPRASRLRQRRR